MKNREAGSQWPKFLTVQGCLLQRLRFDFLNWLWFRVLLSYMIWLLSISIVSVSGLLLAFLSLFRSWKNSGSLSFRPLPLGNCLIVSIATCFERSSWLFVLSSWWLSGKRVTKQKQVKTFSRDYNEPASWPLWQTWEKSVLSVKWFKLGISIAQSRTREQIPLTLRTKLRKPSGFITS